MPTTGTTPIKLAILSMLVLNGSFNPHAQETTSSPQPQTFPAGTGIDSKEGLQSFLEQLLAATKAGNNKQIAALVKETEIPHARKWFLSMYPKDKAESRIGAYEKGLPQGENEFRRLFESLAKSEGQFEIRKVNDEPQAGNRMEASLLHSANVPLEVYYAGWKSSTTPQRIGYFFYIDGAFRWDSLVYFLTDDPGAGSASTGPDQTVSGPIMKVGNGILPPRLLHSEAAEYTPAARSAHLEGTVLLSLVIDVDGRPKQIKVSRSLSKDLDQKALEAVQRFKYAPATRDGVPVPVSVMVVVRFRLD
jgi:TonB family protein